METNQGNLYESVVSRDATNKEANEKILSAYDKMLIDEAKKKKEEGK